MTDQPDLTVMMEKARAVYTLYLALQEAGSSRMKPWCW